MSKQEKCTFMEKPKNRACLKIAFIVVLALIVISLLAQFVTDQTLDELKQNLSLWTIIATVIIINLVSFLCFTTLFLAYRWVKTDLKAADKDKK